MVFGPNMQNFPGVTQQLLASEAAVQVTDEASLQSALTTLLRLPDLRRDLGRNAREVVRRNAGATRRNVELVLRHMAGARMAIDAESSHP
jgi:3-deoxy-D-manno-octulosonic-acid transferase